MTQGTFKLYRDDVKRYFLTSQALQCFGVSLSLGIPASLILMLAVHPLFLLSFLGVGIIVMLVYYYIVGWWLCPRQANNLRYQLEGNVLRVDGGVLFLFRKSIPLERITDIAIIQGPLLRFCGIWAMQIQTAGSPKPEATLYGVCEPEAVRDLILSQRHVVHNEKAGDA